MSPRNLTYLLQAFSLVKVPLLGMIRPRVVELSDSKSTVRLPLNFLTKNHLGSMYFGALAMGAELSVALKVVEMNRVGPRKVSFIFKDFQCEFHQRAETDVVFSCAEVSAISALVEKTLASGERQNGKFQGKAYSAKSPESEPLMSYSLTISMKAQRS